MRINAMDINELRDIMEDNGITNLFAADNGGYLVMDNHGGMSILINKTNETVFVQYFEQLPIEVPISYNNDGEPYFLFRGDRYYFHEFMRNNFGKAVV